MSAIANIIDVSRKQIPLRFGQHSSLLDEESCLQESEINVLISRWKMTRALCPVGKEQWCNVWISGKHLESFITQHVSNCSKNNQEKCADGREVRSTRFEESEGFAESRSNEAFIRMRKSEPDLKSPYAVAKIDSVLNTITVSTFADSNAFAFVNSKIMNATAFQKNAFACIIKYFISVRKVL